MDGWMECHETHNTPIEQKRKRYTTDKRETERERETDWMSPSTSSCSPVMVTIPPSPSRRAVPNAAVPPNPQTAACEAGTTTTTMLATLSSEGRSPTKTGDAVSSGLRVLVVANDNNTNNKTNNNNEDGTTPTSTTTGVGVWQGCIMSTKSNNNDNNNNNDNRTTWTKTQSSIASGGWIESPDTACSSNSTTSPATTASGPQQSHGDSTSSSIQVVHVMDRTRPKLQLVPSSESQDNNDNDNNDESSCGSAVVRVKEAVLRGREKHVSVKVQQYQHHEQWTTTPLATSCAVPTHVDHDTLAELKMARDAAVEQVFLQAKVTYERRSRLIDVLRAMLFVGIYLGLLWSCCHRCDYRNISHQEEQVLLVGEVGGAMFLCFLSSVPFEQREMPNKSGLLHIVFSRKTILLFTYLVIWACTWDQLSSLWESSERCSAFPEARRRIRNMSTSEPLDSSVPSNGKINAVGDGLGVDSTTAGPIVVSIVPESNQDVDSDESEKETVISAMDQDLVVDSFLDSTRSGSLISASDTQTALDHSSHVEERTYSQDQSAPRPDHRSDERAKEPVPKSTHDRDHSSSFGECLDESESIEDEIGDRLPPKILLSLPAFFRSGLGETLPPFSPDASPDAQTRIVSASDSTFGDFRRSALSTQLEEVEDGSMATAFPRKRNLLAPLQVAVKTLKFVLGQLLGIRGHDNEVLMDTLVEVWATTK